MNDPSNKKSWCTKLTGIALAAMILGLVGLALAVLFVADVATGEAGLGIALGAFGLLGLAMALNQRRVEILRGSSLHEQISDVGSEITKLRCDIQRMESHIAECATWHAFSEAGRAEPEVKSQSARVPVWRLLLEFSRCRPTA